VLNDEGSGSLGRLPGPWASTRRAQRAPIPTDQKSSVGIGVAHRPLRTLSRARCATCGGTLNHPSRISLKVDRSVFTRPNLPRAVPSIVGARKLRCEVCFSFLKTLAPAGRNPSGSGPPH